MRNFLVSLTLHIPVDGIIEKLSIHAISADSPKEAIKQALINECHFEPKLADDGLSVVDGDMWYTFTQIIEVSDELCTIVAQL